MPHDAKGLLENKDLSLRWFKGFIPNIFVSGTPNRVKHYFVQFSSNKRQPKFQWPWATLTQTIPFLEEEVKQIYIDFSEIPLFQMGLRIIFNYGLLIIF